MLLTTLRADPHSARAGLFAHRGVVLGAWALALLFLFDAPGARSLPIAVPWIVSGLLLRAWAFTHLGGQGRTRDPRAPSGRVASGPYAWLEHPIYVANLLLAAGLVFAVAPPPLAAGSSLLAAAGVYAVLAARESEQVRVLDVERRPPRSAAQVARSERSTWLTVGVLLALAAL